MVPKDWTQPLLVDSPGDLGPVLVGASLAALEDDRLGRTILLRFALPPETGIAEATFRIRAATHLLAFAYRSPATPLPENLSPEETIAQAGEWAREGIITTFDPMDAGTSLIVARALVHVSEEVATLSVEGYGEDPDVLVWWELRVSGRSFAVETP